MKTIFYVKISATLFAVVLMTALLISKSSPTPTTYVSWGDVSTQSSNNLQTLLKNAPTNLALLGSSTALVE